MRRALALAAALVASLMCVSGAAAAGGDLRIGSPQALETPNPFKAVEAISVESYATMYYDQLGGIRMKDQAADYHNALAKGVDVSRDGKTITFHLRTNIHWSDGKPFTSADALWTLNALLKNKTNQLVGGVPALKSVSAPDAKTFVMHLSTRDAEFLDKLAVPILPAHVWSKIPINQIDKVNGPIPTVTTAPYQLTKWEKNGTTILTRNPRYDLFRNGGKAPAVQRVLITYYANPDSVYRDVSQGNLDYGYSGPPTWARRAKTARNLQLISAPRGGYWEIAFNSCPPKGSPICSGPGKGVNVKVVQDPAIRRAVAYAIDKERFVPTIYENQGVTAYGLISPRFKRYYVNRKDTPLGYPYDPAKARQELK